MIGSAGAVLKVAYPLTEAYVLYFVRPGDSSQDELGYWCCSWLRKVLQSRIGLVSTYKLLWRNLLEDMVQDTLVKLGTQHCGFLVIGDKSAGHLIVTSRSWITNHISSTRIYLGVHTSANESDVV